MKWTKAMKKAHSAKLKARWAAKKSGVAKETKTDTTIARVVYDGVDFVVVQLSTGRDILALKSGVSNGQE